MKPTRISVTSLGIAALVAVSRAAGGAVAHLQTGAHASPVYWATLFYEYLAVPLAVLIFVTSAWVAVRAIGQLRTGAGRGAAIAAIVLSELAVLVAGHSVFQQLFVGYAHTTSITVDASRYHLGIRTALDGDDFFIVTRCRQGSVRCTSHGVAAREAGEATDVQGARLEREASSGALVMRTVTRTVQVPAELQP